MAAAQADRILHQLRWLAHGGAERAEHARSDGQLLDRFISTQDEHAFAELLRRHGPMVLGVCRRLLGHVQDAEDAFQATFLVLVRKARSITPRELVGNWLYGVAYRVALDAQARSSRRRAREKQVEDMPHPSITPADVDPDLRPLLDRELSRLPPKYRAAIVLCDLEGRPRKDAASQLGVPEGTLSSRLNAGRKLLAGRLARHGLTLSGAAIATALAAGPGQAAIPGALAISTIKAAALGAAGQAVALGLVSARAAALTEGVMKAMLISKLKTMTGVLLTIGLFAWGAGVLTLTADDAQAGGKVTQAKQPGAADDQVLRLLRQPDGRFRMLGVAPQEHWQEDAIDKHIEWLTLKEAIDTHNEWLTQHQVRPKTDDLRWDDLLNKLHRYPHGTDFCVSCHKTTAAQTERALRGYLHALERQQTKDGDIIIIRLPKKSNPDEDAQFLRRLCLDLLGRTPTPLETRFFLADKNANKYRAVVEWLAHQADAQPPAPPKIADRPRQVTPAMRAEAYVQEKLGKQQLSPAERHIVERVVEFMQKQPAK
jgi:RNA polymerase sigma factor (sigma-70 family)